MKHTGILIVFVLLLAFVLAGCSAVQALNTAVNTYHGVQGANTVYHAGNEIKSMKDDGSLFTKYETISVTVEIAPRDKEHAKEITDAFRDNMVYIIQKDMETVHMKPLAVCTDAPCTGKTILLQFKEEAYDANLLDKYTLGSSLKGTLYYIDTETNTIVHQDKSEVSKSYSDMLTKFHVSTTRKFLAYRQAAGDLTEQEIKAMNEAMKGFDPIKPEYKDLLKKS